LNGEHGLGAIFPAMVNALEALAVLGYASTICGVWPRSARCGGLCRNGSEAYCQPCVSPVWDSALACLAMQETGGASALAASTRVLEWLEPLQLLESDGDWRARRPGLAGGGWAFQFSNGYYPDLDDTAVVAWAMHQADDAERYAHSVNRALDWLTGMQSGNGGFALVRRRQHGVLLNEIPFADHGALLDPPTSDVTARVVTVLARVGRHQDNGRSRGRSRIYAQSRKRTARGSAGGTNYIYGTWSVLTALCAGGRQLPMTPQVRRAVGWLTVCQMRMAAGREQRQLQRPAPVASRTNGEHAPQRAWRLLALIASRRGRSLTAPGAYLWTQARAVRW